mgnify:CR=1 FL=1
MLFRQYFVFAQTCTQALLVSIQIDWNRHIKKHDIDDVFDFLNVVQCLFRNVKNKYTFRKILLYYIYEVPTKSSSEDIT